MDDIKREFQKFDKDGNGYISLEEAQQVLNKELGFPPEKTRTLVKVYDRNNDGHLSYEEFIWFYWKIQEKKNDLFKIFRKFDADGNSVISFEEARAVMRGLGFSETEISDLFKIHDKNHDGCLQYEEFVQFWGACGGHLPKGSM